MDDDLAKEITNDFIVESYEGLDSYDRDILDIEQGNSNKETLNNIFRAIHTVKGTAGCLGFSKIEGLAHVGENLLSLVREGKIKVSQEMITPLLDLSDALRSMLKTLEASDTEGTDNHTALIAKLETLQGNRPASSELEEEPAGSVSGEDKGDEVASDVGFGLFEEDGTDAAEVDEGFGLFEEQDKVECVDTEPSEAPNIEQPTGSLNKPSIANNSIRVDVDHLDKVMNMVGELVLTRNQISISVDLMDQKTLQTAYQRLNTVTSELQEGIMKTRMQPIGSIWATFPRVVRDISRELGKKVRLIMDGQSTELDRTLIEAVKDPLMHIIRNSIDHGIELPDTRRSNGKSEEGLLSLRAFHEGGQVNIEIMDDGGGVNIAKVKEKAVEQHLISPKQAQRLPDRDAVNLIFMPGLSSAQEVSSISGRGVGMDVVKTNIEKTGGSIDLNTQEGQGTTIRIKIPLTLAIIPALVVTSGGNRFAIPQVSLLELLRIEADDPTQRIEMLYGSPVYRLRGQILPLTFLNKTLELKSRAQDGSISDTTSIIVLEADGQRFGLVVDQINDTEEIVVKPLGKQLKNISCFAGSTIMGDGRIALIIDVLGLAQHANLITESEGSFLVEETSETDESLSKKQNLLLFKSNDIHLMALPLSQAARLEEFAADQVERSGNQEVVQYRGQILPLIRVADYIDSTIGSGVKNDEAPLQVVVYSESGHSVGFVVHSINDIVEEEISIQRGNKARGIKGSAVIHGKVTDLLDVQSIILSANPSFYEYACSS